MWLIALTSSQESGVPNSAWWDLSSFGPDLIVGVVTGGVVAAVVLFVEKRSARRTASESVARQQEHAIEMAQLALREAHIFPSVGATSLMPAGENMKRLHAAVQAVAPEPSARSVFGYPLVAAAVRVFESLVARADSVAVRIDTYDGQAAGTGVAAALYGRVTVLADLSEKHAPFPITEPRRLEDWDDGTFATRALDPLLGNLDDDTAFKANVNQYLDERWRFEKLRRAFLSDFEELRSELQEIDARALDAPGLLVGKRCAERRRRREYEAAIATRVKAATRVIESLSAGD